MVSGSIGTYGLERNDWDLDVQAAVAFPHLLNWYGTYELEEGTAAESFKPSLEALGYSTSVRRLDSGLQAIAVTPSLLRGAADPRREGVASGG